jgi:NitT/TauT family transport system substrate-binding protein
MEWLALRIFACRFAAVVALLPAASLASAADTIRIMVAGIDKQIYLPATLAQRLGYFTAQGLSVELSSEASGVHAEDQLLTGAVQAVVGFYDHTISLQAKGKFVQAVVQFSQAPGEAVLVGSRLADTIRSPADFRGRTIGVTGLGSSTHLLTQYLAVANGLKAGEMRFVAVGAGDTFAAALRQGSIDAGTTSEPTVSRLLQSGDARLLVDLRTPQSTEQVLGGVYPGACLYVTTRWAASHRSEVQRLVNALVMALRYAATHSAEEITAHLPAENSLADKALFVAALRDSKAMFIADGTMPPSGPETVLRVMKRVDRSVQGKAIDLARTYTTEFTAAAP